MLSRYAMPSPWAQEFNLCMAEDRKTAHQESSGMIEDLRIKVSALAEKSQRLLDVYLAQDIDRETYFKERSKLFSEKKSAEENIARLERNAGAWLEPMQAWVLTASTLGEIAERNDLPSKKSSLQKIFGSNLTLHDKKVRENPSPAYAALRAAREKFALSDTSFIRAPRASRI